ncbi:hypothetical protein B0H21DRAFT_823301 [Amylocystis lapponica]|nr:hypothetical protein B0H21DRAFT_823301 [Amylocystis lapponica]
MQAPSSQFFYVVLGGPQPGIFFPLRPPEVIGSWVMALPIVVRCRSRSEADQVFTLQEKLISRTRPDMTVHDILKEIHKFYCIPRGREQGIFYGCTWSSIEWLVLNYPNNRYKAKGNMRNALAFMLAHGNETIPRVVYAPPPDSTLRTSPRPCPVAAVSSGGSGSSSSSPSKRYEEIAAALSMPGPSGGSGFVELKPEIQDDDLAASFDGLSVGSRRSVPAAPIHADRLPTLTRGAIIPTRALGRFILPPTPPRPSPPPPRIISQQRELHGVVETYFNGVPPAGEERIITLGQEADDFVRSLGYSEHARLRFLQAYLYAETEDDFVEELGGSGMPASQARYLWPRISEP